MSRASRGTAHLALIPAGADSDFLDVFLADNLMFYSIFGVPESESAVSFRGVAVAPPTQIFQPPGLSQKLNKNMVL